jgi:hypothetical protein
MPGRGEMVVRGFDGEAYDRNIRELAEARAEIERLHAIVDRLSKTKDGVPIIPCVDSVWHPDFTGSGTAKECGRAYWACYMRKIDECYSTREAVEAARGEAGE